MGQTKDLPARVVTAAVIPRFGDGNPDILALTFVSGATVLMDPETWAFVGSTTTGRRNNPSFFNIDDAGWSISSDPHGKVLSLPSFRNKVRLYTLGSRPQHHDDDGSDTYFDAFCGSHVSVSPTNSPKVDSHSLELPATLILHSCFLFPLKGVNSRHLFYLVLYVADNSRLKFEVYEWWTMSPLKSLSHNTTAPLPSSFAENLPIFLIPTPHSDGCAVIVTATRVVLLKLPDILSGRFDYAEASLPSLPVAYYQERIMTNDSHATYDDIQYLYLATESNVIYTVTVDAGNDKLSVQPLVDLEASIGSSLVIQPCTEDGKIDTTVSINDAAYLMIDTAGDGVVGGNFFVKSTEEGVAVEYVSDYQQFGPICDAITLSRADAFESLSPNLVKDHSYELILSSGCSSSSSALVHVRQGMKASIALNGLSMEGAKQLFSVQTDSVQYFLVSFPYYTSILQIIGEETDTLQIVDSGEASGFNLHEETLAFASHSDCIIQVTPSAIIVRKQEDTKSTTGLRLLRAYVYNDFIAVLTKESTKVFLNLYQLAPDEPSSDYLTLLCTRHVESEVTMLKILWSDSVGLQVYLGTLEAELLIFALDFSQTVINFNSFDPKLANEIANDVVYSEDKLIIGMRSGTLAVMAEDTVELEKLDNFPVRFFKSSENLFAHSQFLYALGTGKLLGCPIRVVIDDTNLFEVQACCLFPFSSSYDGSEVIASVINEELNLLVIDEPAGLVTRRIPIRAVPRRLLHLSHINMIAVLFHRSCKSSTQSFLRFVDPKKGIVVTPGNEDWDGWKTKPSRSTSEEVMYCMAEWTFSVNGGKFKYLLVGGGLNHTTSDSGQSCGYLYALTVGKSKSSRVELQKRFVLQEDSPFYSVIQVDEKSIICATHNKLILYQLLIENNKSKVVKKASFDSISCPIINLVFHNGMLFAATLKNSVYVYRYSEETLLLLCGDRMLRAPITQCVLKNGLLVVADKQRNVAFYSVPPLIADTTELSSSTLNLVSSTSLPTCIAKLLPVPTAGCQESEDVLAIGVDGSIYRFTFLTSPVSRDNPLVVFTSLTADQDANPLNDTEKFLTKNLIDCDSIERRSSRNFVARVAHRFRVL